MSPLGRHTLDCAANYRQGHALVCITRHHTNIPTHVPPQPPLPPPPSRLHISRRPSGVSSCTSSCGYDVSFTCDADSETASNRRSGECSFMEGGEKETGERRPASCHVDMDSWKSRVRACPRIGVHVTSVPAWPVHDLPRVRMRPCVTVHTLYTYTYTYTYIHTYKTDACCKLQ